MSVTSWVLLAIFLALIVSRVRAAQRTPEQVAAMRQLVARGGQLVDVRSPGEYQAHHLEGALNIPLGSLQARASELGDPAEPLVVYCASGQRSARAAGALRSMGFKQVHDLGSWRNW